MNTTSEALAALKVAEVTIPKPITLYREHESAAAYYAVSVPAGVYPVESRVTATGERYLAAVFSGVCVASGYGARVYANDVGKPGEVVYQPYKYQLRNGTFWGAVTITNADALAAVPGV